METDTGVLHCVWSPRHLSGRPTHTRTCKLYTDRFTLMSVTWAWRRQRNKEDFLVYGAEFWLEEKVTIMLCYWPCNDGDTTWNGNFSLCSQIIQHYCGSLMSRHLVHVYRDSLWGIEEGKVQHSSRCLVQMTTWLGHHCCPFTTSL